MLYTVNPQVNIWSYQPVSGEGYIERLLRPQERIVMEGGAVVTFDGERVLVNNQAVISRNAIVERDGTIIQGAFIRRFD